MLDQLSPHPRDFAGDMQVMIKVIYTVVLVMFLTILFSVFLFLLLAASGDGILTNERLSVLAVGSIFYGLTVLTIISDSLTSKRLLAWWPRGTDFVPMDIQLFMLCIILVTILILVFFGNDINEFMIQQASK